MSAPGIVVQATCTLNQHKLNVPTDNLLTLTFLVLHSFALNARKVKKQCTEKFFCSYLPAAVQDTSPEDLSGLDKFDVQGAN